jgi:hypothetical protein
MELSSQSAGSDSGDKSLERIVSSMVDKLHIQIDSTEKVCCLYFHEMF